MFKKMLSICVMSSLLYITVPPAFAQQQQSASPQIVPVPPPVKPPTGSLVVPAAVSLAVVQTTASAMLTLSNHITAGHATSADYASAATASQAMFANFDEAAFSQNIVAFVLANETLFTTNPTTAQLQYAYNNAVSAGSVLTFAQFESAILSSTLSDRETMYTDLSTGGVASLDQMFAAAVSGLQGLSAAMQRQKNGAIYSLAKFDVGFALRAAGLYLAVVGLVVATGGAGAVALGVGLGIAGVGAGAAGEIAD